jgi:phage tail-like protein
MVQPSQRGYAAAHFALELDGEAVGLFRSIEGGGLRREVATHHAGGRERWKQLAKPKHEDVKLQVGMAMAAPFVRWIASFMAGGAVRKNGAIIAADFAGMERSRRELIGAVITEVAFPRLDAQDRGAAYLTVGLAVEGIAVKPGDPGRRLVAPAGQGAQRQWTACNFRLRIDGLEQACRRVTKIDAFAVKQSVVEHHVGGALSPIKVPGAIELPTVTAYVPETDAQPFADALRDRHAPLTGALEYLARDGRTLMEVSLRGASIAAVAPDRCDAQTEDIKLVKVELCIEGMAFA